VLTVPLPELADDFEMNRLTPNEIRFCYLTFFEQRAHRVVASSPVVPEGDPTLLFTNAGMNQFKDVLLGLERRDYTRATSVQKCIRAGGKHNDLDEVGKDGRHLTFFEMLGNWSFGDYYKKESIEWAWEFVTTELGLDPERIRVSVYKDDDDSWDLWQHHIGVPPERITRLGDVEAGDEENFWSMGPTGPCGPCTEIYFDQHPEAGPAAWAPGFDDERFLEIWNIVFMEFNRDEAGTLTPLPMQSVDTGMGLDRVAALLAGVDNVFRTDLFAGILECTHALLGGDRLPASEIHAHPSFVEYCVIADHIRTVTFAICDGAQFANEGRGYVLRRILRRAVRHGRNLGFTAPFLHRVVDAVIHDFQHVYPELRLKGRDAAQMILREEERFFRTLERGLALFDDVAEAAAAAGGVIDGNHVFRLYDTFGFPPDLTRIMAEERGLTVDEAAYELAMQAQQARSRAADGRYVQSGEWEILQDGIADRFVGYAEREVATRVLRFRRAPDANYVEICLEATPFYAESGGQVGDSGTIESETNLLVLRVTDTQRTTAGITHFAEVVDGVLSAEALSGGVVARVDGARRELCAQNHTATHLLHAALHRVVSNSALQAGSLVSAERLRFDFAHDTAVTKEQLSEMESWVNEQIRQATDVQTHANVALHDAESMGAMMIFGEKYGERVRVVQIAGESVELCGRTHVRNTSEIGLFRILSEGGIAAGVRRIEAVTGARAFALFQEDRDRLDRLAQRLRAPVQEVEERVDRLTAAVRQLEREVQTLQRGQLSVQAEALSTSAESVGPVRCVASVMDVPDRDALLELVDLVRSRLGEQAVGFLAARIDDKPALVVFVTEAATRAHGLKAGELIRPVAESVGGRGGGKPTLAQAGGRDLEALDGTPNVFRSTLQSALAGE
jgi:alanyl-tRNA synthetase